MEGLGGVSEMNLLGMRMLMNGLHDDAREILVQLSITHTHTHTHSVWPM